MVPLASDDSSPNRARLAPTGRRSILARTIGTGLPVTRTVRVHDTDAAEAKRDHDTPWLYVWSDEHPLADRLSLVSREPGDDSTPCLREPPPDHRCIVVRQCNRRSPRVRPMHRNLGVHAGAAAQAPAAAITRHLPATTTQTGCHQQGRNRRHIRIGRQGAPKVPQRRTAPQVP
jgi:hypothetical protein